MNQPQAFGPYHLVDHIATGGMADIFASIRTGERSFEKVLVVKRIHERLCTPDFIQMFVNEARISARLDHPNIVQVHDFGSVDGRYYIAMEWVHGKTAKQLMRHVTRARILLRPEHVVPLVSDVARALEYAHQGGVDKTAAPVVHRDVSLSNVLISYTGHVKLADFGIAKVHGTDEATDTGMLKGKFAYISPEQAEGDSATTQSDLFSLGVVLWELLTARRLFKTDSQVRTLKRVRSEVAPPPSRYARDVPRVLDELTLKLLEKDPRNRFGTATDLLDALHDVAEALPRIRPDALSQVMDTAFYVDRTDELARIEAGRAQLQGKASSYPPHLAGPEPTPSIGTPTQKGSMAQMLEHISQYYARADGRKQPDIRGRVLIVDDVAENRELLGRTLSRLGHEVFEAIDGTQALEGLDDVMPDIVLLDINMPGQDGFQVLGTIRERLSITELPVIMVSAREAGQDIVRALKEGANDYITKPFDRQVVAARVHSQLLMRLAFETLVTLDERYRNYAENTTDLVFHITANATLLFVSKSARSMLGFPVHEMLGQPFFDFVYRDDKRIVRELFVDVMAKLEPDRVVHRFVANSGSLVWVETSVQPIIDERTGRATGVQGAARDVSRYVVEESSTGPRLKIPLDV